MAAQLVCRDDCREHVAGSFEGYAFDGFRMIRRLRGVANGVP